MSEIDAGERGLQWCWADTRTTEPRSFAWGYGEFQPYTPNQISLRAPFGADIRPVGEDYRDPKAVYTARKVGAPRG